MIGRFVDHLLLIARSAKRNMPQRYRLVREKVRDVCERAEKVEVLESKGAGGFTERALGFKEKDVQNRRRV